MGPARKPKGCPQHLTAPPGCPPPPADAAWLLVPPGEVTSLVPPPAPGELWWAQTSWQTLPKSAPIPPTGLRFLEGAAQSTRRRAGGPWRRAGGPRHPAPPPGVLGGQERSRGGSSSSLRATSPALRAPGAWGTAVPRSPFGALRFSEKEVFAGPEINAGGGEGAIGGYRRRGAEGREAGSPSPSLGREQPRTEPSQSGDPTSRSPRSGWGVRGGSPVGPPAPRSSRAARPVPIPPVLPQIRAPRLAQARPDISGLPPPRGHLYLGGNIWNSSVAEGGLGEHQHGSVCVAPGPPQRTGRAFCHQPRHIPRHIPSPLTAQRRMPWPGEEEAAAGCAPCLSPPGAGAGHEVAGHPGTPGCSQAPTPLCQRPQGVSGR